MAEHFFRGNEVRQNFAACINKVAFGGDRVVIVRHQTEMAAVIPMHEYRELQRLRLGKPEPAQEIYQRAMKLYWEEIRRIQAEDKQGEAEPGAS